MNYIRIKYPSGKIERVELLYKPKSGGLCVYSYSLNKKFFIPEKWQI